MIPKGTLALELMNQTLVVCIVYLSNNIYKIR